jgi:hypothetical protein
MKQPFAAVIEYESHFERQCPQVFNARDSKPVSSGTAIGLAVQGVLAVPNRTLVQRNRTQAVSLS